MLLSVLLATLSAPSVLGCATHEYHPQLSKRAAPGDDAPQWAYEASYDWGRLSPDYSLCQDGTQQAPIPLRLDQGLSLNHFPVFDRYNMNVSGTFQNWGYGPGMTLAHPPNDYTSLPSFTFEEEEGEEETVYLTGWHIHSPADHTVQGQRSKSEMHFVHVDSEGNNRAVLAFRIDPGSRTSGFFESLPELISYRELNRTVEAMINPGVALREVDEFSEFWSYKGE